MTQMVWVVKNSPCKLKDGGSIFALVVLRGKTVSLLTKKRKATKEASQVMIQYTAVAFIRVMRDQKFRTVARLRRLC